MNVPKQILKMLRSELNLQARHRKILEAQQRALIACDREQFCSVQLAYIPLLAELELQDTDRRAMLIDVNGAPQTLTAVLETLPEKHRKSLSVLRDSLKETLERVQTLNTQNQQLIENEMKYFAFTLDLFVEAGRSAENAYGGGFLFGRMLLDRRA